MRRLQTLLATLSPFPSFLSGRSPPDVIERQIVAGAFESAALNLAGPAMGVMFSRSPNGVAVASAWIPERSEEQTVKADEPSVALCGAIALVVAMALRSGPEPASARVN